MGGSQSSLLHNQIDPSVSSCSDKVSKCTCPVPLPPVNTKQSQEPKAPTMPGNKSGKKGRKGKRLSSGSSADNDSNNDLIANLQHLSLDNKQTAETLTLEDDFPQSVLYYGWFFSHEVSLMIKTIADAYFSECLNVNQFQRFMKDCCTLYGIRDVQEYYRKPGKVKASEELKYHITAKFLGREPNEQYAKMVQQFTGKTFRMHLVGLYFTQKSFGIRIKLTDGQKTVFDEREGKTKDVLSVVKSTKKLDEHVNSISAPDSTNNLKIELQSYLKISLKKAKDPKCKSTLHSRFAKEGIILIPQRTNEFQPTTSRAHITIGCAPKVKAIQTGIDLLDIIDLEKRAASTTSVFHQDFDIDGGTLRQFGRFGDAFVIYPCHEIVAEATFDTFI